MSPRERIKQVRQALSLTQGKFAERIAISTSYLSDMEHGKNPVGERIIRLISMEFKVDEHWLRTGDGAMFHEDTDLNLIKANGLFKSLSHEFQEHALIMLNSLYELSNRQKDC